ncbi:MAG: hypothetical protein IIZ80_01420, partial [Erysipelotrichaceae bacterium]|nr:hypothetical protein [Erysipelotrichaceae bacterium]
YVEKNYTLSIIDSRETDLILTAIYDKAGSFEYAWGGSEGIIINANGNRAVITPGAEISEGATFTVTVSADGKSAECGLTYSEGRLVRTS